MYQKRYIQARGATIGRFRDMLISCCRGGKVSQMYCAESEGCD